MTNLCKWGLKAFLPWWLAHLVCFPSSDSLAVTNTGVLSKLQPTIGNLSNLTSLDLRRGGFVGSLPTELGLLTTLRYLMLDTNDLVGSIPTELGTMTILGTFSFFLVAAEGRSHTTSVSWLDTETATFHDTWVSGAMPPSICQLRAPSASLKNLTANCKLQDESSSLSTDIRFLSSLRVSCECCTMCL